MFLRSIFFGLGLLFSLPAHAATLYLDPATATLNRGDSVTLNVRLDTDEATHECINAIDGVITYDDSVTPVDVSVGQSIFPVWVEQPIIHKDTHTITFAGGIPNGYCGRVEGDPRLTNTIVQLIFRAPGLQVGGGEARNQATIDFDSNTTAYLNDGQGTVANMRTIGTTIKLNDGVGSTISDEWRAEVQTDVTPPEKFSIDLEHDTKTFGGRYFIVFNTTDKQTGIDTYEVIEEPLSRLNLFDFGSTNAPWLEVRSPYVLKDQSLNSTIRVRATDKAGNQYIATLIPDESVRASSWVQWLPVLYLMSGAGVILFLFFVVWRWWVARRAKTLAKNLRTETVDSK